MLPAPTASRDPIDLAEVVAAIGSDGFAARMLRYLDGLLGADRCAIYRLAQGGPEEIGAAGRSGLTKTGRSELTPFELRRLLRMPTSSEPRIEIRSLAATGQLVILCGRAAEAGYGLMVLRAADEGRGLDELHRQAGLLIALAAKHAEMTGQRPRLTPALSSLDEIQGCILAATDLSRREAEVCARALYGMTSVGIALDLGIGKESVMTYRKRAYHRLAIGSQRELLMWYLAVWSETERTHAPARPVPGRLPLAAAYDRASWDSQAAHSA